MQRKNIELDLLNINNDVNTEENPYTRVLVAYYILRRYQLTKYLNMQINVFLLMYVS